MAGVTTVPPRHPLDLQASTRLVCLLRLLLLVLGWALLMVSRHQEQDLLTIARPVLERVVQLLIAVSVASGILVLTARWMERTWQLMLHMVFDLAWVSYLIYLTGGVLGPACPLLFAVVLTCNLVLPGFPPFLIPSLAGLGLGLSAVCYLADVLPLGTPESRIPDLVRSESILSALVAQGGALFLVDLLAQLLARRLKESRSLIASLIDQLGEGVLVIDAHERVLFANAESERMLHPREQLVPGRPLAPMLAEDVAPAILDLVRDPALPASRRMLTADGRHLTLRAGLLKARKRRVLGRTLTISDETRLAFLEADAARSERLAELGEMAAGIAHEIRNPLSSLRGCAQELSSMAQGDDHPDAAALTRILITEADRLGRIVDDFLVHSRLRPPEWRDLDLRLLFTELDHLYRLRDGKPGQVQPLFVVDPALGAMRGDADQLRQAIINLVNNALDAVGQTAKPLISIEARPALGEDERLAVPSWVVAVSDNGAGIPSDRLERVFTPFYSSKSQGTGLGLTLVQRLVQQAGGAVRLASEVTGGTTVRLILPCRETTPN